MGRICERSAEKAKIERREELEDRLDEEQVECALVRVPICRDMLRAWRSYTTPHQIGRGDNEPFARKCAPDEQSVTDAIKLYLDGNAPEDLAKLYHVGLEVQVGVKKH